jgi:hypothetical protein
MERSIWSILKKKGMRQLSVRWRMVLFAAAALSLVDALVHALVAPEHFAEWWGYGIFFVLTAAFQVLYSVVLLLRSQPPVLLAGVVGNLMLMALYIITRTAGVPLLGPSAGEAQMVEQIDLVSKTVEVALVVALGALLWHHPPYCSIP